MTSYVSPDGRVIHGAHIGPITIKCGGRKVTLQAHVMVWWLTGGVAKGMTGQYSMH